MPIQFPKLKIPDCESIREIKPEFMNKIALSYKGKWNKIIVLLFCQFLITFSIDAQNPINPNIVLLLSDDHGAADLGFTGNKDVSTPVLDQLAKDGMVFDRAFAAASVCAPSRSAIYTGMYPHKNGGHQNHGSIRRGIKTMPEYLKEQGYRIALAGKVHVAPEVSFPFEYIERQEIPAFLESVKQEPFCLIIAYNNPHEPYFNKKNGVSPSQIQAKKWMPDTPETRMLTAAYYDNVENLDHEVGTSLYWLENAGFTDNTVIIYTSDHGPGLPFGKWTLYEQALQVPLIIKWKGIIPPGSQSGEMVSLVDVLPTFIELAGGKIPAGLDGKSLLPFLSGKKPGRHHQFIFAAYTNLGVQDANPYPIRSIRSDRYKLIVNFNHEEPFTIRMTNRMDDRALICGFRVLESWKKIANKNAFAAARYKQFRYRPKLELYDLENDPYELENLIDQADYAKIQIALATALQNWLKEQHDAVFEKMQN